mgnify:CR=1 FL=1
MKKIIILLIILPVLIIQCSNELRAKVKNLNLK